MHAHTQHNPEHKPFYAISQQAQCALACDGAACPQSKDHTAAAVCLLQPPAHKDQAGGWTTAPRYGLQLSRNVKPSYNQALKPSCLPMHQTKGPALAPQTCTHKAHNSSHTCSSCEGATTLCGCCCTTCMYTAVGAARTLICTEHGQHTHHQLPTQGGSTKTPTKCKVNLQTHNSSKEDQQQQDATATTSRSAHTDYPSARSLHTGCGRPCICTFRRAGSSIPVCCLPSRSHDW